MNAAFIECCNCGHSDECHISRMWYVGDQCGKLNVTKRRGGQKFLGFIICFLFDKECGGIWKKVLLAVNLTLLAEGAVYTTLNR